MHRIKTYSIRTKPNQWVDKDSLAFGDHALDIL